MQPELINIENRMKQIVCYLMLLCACMQLQAQTYDELITCALDAAKNDSLTKSEILFKQALKMDPANMRNALLFTNLGTVQRRLGKIDDAIDSYTLSLNITPYSVVTLLNRASLYLEKNLFDRAYVDYCNVIDIDKTNKEALLFRAYIYMQRRDYKGARIDYNTLLQEVSDNPRDVSYLKARATLAVEMNTPDLALLDLEEAAKLAPDDAEIYVMCGEIYLSQKKKREAYVAFEKAIELGVPRPELQDKLKASK